MKSLTLKRISPKLYPDNQGTFGVLVNDADCIPFAVTLEPPWKNNQRNVSCIPAGKYICGRISTTRFQVCNVPGRTEVTLHPGNILKNTEACILVAEKFGRLVGSPAIITSKNKKGEGFNELMAILKGEKAFFLTILWC